jgi:putative flippase GtrA
MIWVFSSNKETSAWVEFAVFAVIGIVGLGLNELLIWLITEVMSFQYLLSKIFATGVVFFWNFLARKFFLLGGSLKDDKKNRHYHRGRSGRIDGGLRINR